MVWRKKRFVRKSWGGFRKRRVARPKRTMYKRRFKRTARKRFTRRGTGGITKWFLIDRTEVAGCGPGAAAMIQPVVQLDDCPGYANLTGLYTQYKMQKIMIRYRLAGQDYSINLGPCRATVIAGTVPTIAPGLPQEEWIGYTWYGTNPPSQYAASARQMPGAVSMRFGSQQHRYFSKCSVAKYLPILLETAITTSEGAKTGWMNCDETGLNHYGPVVVHSNEDGLSSCAGLGYWKELWAKVSFRGLKFKNVQKF